MKYLNLAVYYFYKPKGHLKTLQKKLKRTCDELELLGTILVAKEGINCFVAGKEESVYAFEDFLLEVTEAKRLDFKESWSTHIPFRKMCVKLKDQILTFKVPGINPGKHRSPSIEPKELEQWLSDKKEFTLLDTRNAYEVEIGTFKQADHFDIRHFRYFKDKVKNMPEELKKKPLVMFCTGGIRCEKAGPLMEKEGFEKVYQLEGGILNYFEKVGGKHWKGDCFVFDDRIAVKPNLEETAKVICQNCGHPATKKERQEATYKFGKCCPKCHQASVRQT